MKQGSKYIAQSDLSAWLTELAGQRRVIAPRQENGTVVYREYDAAKGLELVCKTTESAKHILFPRSEELFSFRKGYASSAKESLPGITLMEPEPPKSTVVFALLGCDAGGVATFDPICDGERFPDVYYLKRREATVFIVKACNDSLSTCFCRWVGGDPADTRYADVLATDLGEGILLEPLTDKAAQVLHSEILKDATAEQSKNAKALHEAVRGAMDQAPALQGVDTAMHTRFADVDFWWKYAAGCIACGTCTYLCPTCHCFTITDEAAGGNGIRLRSWDTCMAALYTLEASGHNPRALKAARLKNRVAHKFSYFLRNNKGAIACCGCGRCIKNCPSSVDIRRIVLDAVAKAAQETAHV